MKEFINSIFESSKERLKNPFVSAFLLAWIGFNWRPISYLFYSVDKISQRIEYIDEHFILQKN